MVLAKEQPKNIIAHVSLGHEAEAVWIDALADIGKAIRLHSNRPTGFLKIGEEVAVEQPDGFLRISTTIADEKVEMDVPPGMWAISGDKKQTKRTLTPTI